MSAVVWLPILKASQLPSGETRGRSMSAVPVVSAFVVDSVAPLDLAASTIHKLEWYEARPYTILLPSAESAIDPSASSPVSTGAATAPQVAEAGCHISLLSDAVCAARRR